MTAKAPEFQQSLAFGFRSHEPLSKTKICGTVFNIVGLDLGDDRDLHVLMAMGMAHLAEWASDVSRLCEGRRQEERRTTLLGPIKIEGSQDVHLIRTPIASIVVRHAALSTFTPHSAASFPIAEMACTMTVTF